MSPLADSTASSAFTASGTSLSASAVRWPIDQFHERAFLLFQSKVQIYKVRIVGLVSSGRQYRGIYQGYYSGLLF
jgi:hypothetical protein